MKEIEIKAHASMELKEDIDALTGTSGSPVDKDDLYFRRPGEEIQALRIRVNNGKLEFTAKRQSYGELSEENLEFEVSLSVSERDNAIGFFKCLGFEEYFRKHKRGYSWVHDGIHIELLEVNDLGSFLEMEALLPFSAGEVEVRDAQRKLYDLIDRFSLRGNIERTSYREMILNGIQSKSHTC